MAATAVIGAIPYPSIPPSMSGSDASMALDATTDYVCWVIKAPATGTIDKCYFRIGSTTLVGTLSCQIQTLDASGDPSGSAYGSCAQSDLVVAGTEDNTNLTFSSLACSATKGDFIAIKLWSSAVTSGSGSIAFPAASLASVNFPYGVSRTTGSGAGTHSAAIGGSVSLEYSGAVFYEIGLLPACALNAINVDADSSVRRAGNIITPAVPITTTGCWAFVEVDNDTGTFKLYGTDGTTVLATHTLSSANRCGGSGCRINLPPRSRDDIDSSSRHRYPRHRQLGSCRAHGAATAGYGVLLHTAQWDGLG
jgi:hypothetical protein